MADKDDKIIKKVLHFQEDSRLGPSPAEPTLSLATAMDYIEAQAKRAGAKGPKFAAAESILYLGRCFRRMDDGSIPTSWSGCQELKETLLTVANTLFFAAATDGQLQVLEALLEDGRVPPALMKNLLEAGAEADPRLRETLVQRLSKALQGRHLGELRSAQFNQLMCVLNSNKAYVQALFSEEVKAQVWCPVAVQQFTWKNKKGEVTDYQRPGFALQEKSLMGWALSCTVCDLGLMPPSKAHLHESGSSEWQNMRKTEQQLKAMKATASQKQKEAMQQGCQLAECILKAGDVPRNEILKWLGIMVCAAEPRGMSGHVAPEGFNFWYHQGSHLADVLLNPQSPPFLKSFKNMLLLQALSARIHGFPTSGTALNVFNVLMDRCKPIALEKATTFSPYYTLRTDIPDFLGSWGKASRMGDGEDLERAKAEAQKADCYTKAPADKSLFMTEMFWLAYKAIGTCFLPVAKEGLESMQYISAMMYQKGVHDNFEDAFRQQVLAEAAMKDESTFVERLGHLMNLCFRVLGNAAAGGGDCLPAQDAGPMWHALPADVLEHLVDLCNIYRARDRRGNPLKGIPTGLYSHLEPVPMLKVIMNIMTSKGHVSDASMVGRLAKLMHRVCTSYQSWMMLLSAPELKPHLAPAIVGAFVGVERAIMSYYDLDYRYKYELRIPIMDLMVKLFDDKGHRDLFHAYICGEGKNAFIDMFTMMINDANSMIAVAITSLEKFRTGVEDVPQGESQGPNPDGDDDAEDLYRRSREKYDEKAKKYFGLSKQSFKMMTFLCEHFPDVIVQSHMLLEQLLHTTLDYQLDSLVGPGMAKIKAQGGLPDYQNFDFEPKDLIKQCMQMYTSLSKADSNEVIRIIGRDGRYFKVSTFSKAGKFAGRYGLFDQEKLAEWEPFVQKLQAHSQQQGAEEEVDTPEEFLCEMTYCIMSNPVQLPQSRKILDYTAAERAVRGSGRDPYANTDLNLADLILLPELKEKIHKFAKEHNILLEGGNMFD